MSAGLRAAAAGSASPCDWHDADRAAPVVEEVEDVALAELDAHRPAARAPSRPLASQALAIPIDPAIRHGQRHAAVRPPAHLLERRSRDAHEVAAVLPTEIGFELAAVFRKIWHRRATICKVPAPHTELFTDGERTRPQRHDETQLFWLSVLGVLAVKSSWTRTTSTTRVITRSSCAPR